MVKRSSLDPLEEARARVKLRYAKAKPVHPGPKTIGTAAMRLARKKLPQKAETIDDEKLRAAIVALGEAVLTAEPETPEGEAPSPLPF